MGYAIVGNIDKAELLSLSKDIYHQLSQNGSDMSHTSSKVSP